MNNKAFSHLSILFLSLFLSLFLVSELSAQAGMQRLFNADERDIINSCNSPLRGGGFYLVNFFNEPSTAQADSIGINITKHEPKGDLTWSRDYMIEDASYGNENKILACQLLPGDSLMIVAVDQTSFESEGIKYMFKIEPLDGEVVWANQFSDINKDDNTAEFYGSYPVVLESASDKSINYIGSHDSGDTVAIHFEQMDSMYNTVWSNSFHAHAGIDSVQTNLALVNAVRMRDSGFLMTTAVGENNLTAGILDINSIGTPRSAASFRIDDPLIDFVLEFSAIAETIDTGFVVAGTCRHGFTSKGFVLKLDSFYNVQWAKLIELDPTGVNIAGDVVVSESGEIVVAGKYLEGGFLNSGYYSLFLANNGSLLNSVAYKPDESVFADLTSGLLPGIDLNNDSSDATMHFTTTGATGTLEGYAPIWIKMEQDGAATCHDTLTVSSLNNISIARDTLGILTSQFAERTDLVVRKENWERYDVPIVNLQDTTYCPQDPIMYTIDATTNNAAAYAWSTGDTTATTFVTEEGEYSVTVTMEDRICFTLCDTVMVSQQGYPVISLNFDDSRYCQDKEFDLTVGATTGTAGGVEWDNGPGTAVFSTENRIAIAHEPGKLYSVTITDNCDNQADTTFVVPNYVPPSNVVFGESTRALCEFGALFISADWPEGYQPLNYLWSDNTMTQEIRVENAGVYSVTITDNCGHTAASSYTVDPEDFDVPDPAVEILVGALNCENGFPSIILTADAVPGRPDIGISYLWNTSSNQRQLLVTEPGTYSVVVTDDCGQVVSDEVTITPDDLVVPPPTVTIDKSGFNGGSCDIILTAQGEAASGFNIVITQWSTGSLENSISVTEPGVYEVIVTDECGQTATASIEVTAAELDPEDPTVAINNEGVNPSDCSITLTSVTTVGSGLSITQTQWSTGSLNGSISVNEPGTYEVIVTDNCGQTASAQIVITEADLDQEDPSVSIQSTSVSAEDCTIVLTSDADAGSGLSITATQWSNGSLDGSITVDMPGTYEVIVTDNCGQTASEVITLTDADFDIPTPEVSIIVDQDFMGDSCQVRLIAQHNVEGFPTFMWSTGDVTNSIIVDSYGVFTVTVSTCGQATQALFERTQDSDIRWPNIFFPQNPVHDVNRTFGPQLDCPENFPGNFTLEIFNRWGKRVYETDNIAERWSGTLNNQGNFLEEDVYMYQWSYEEGEVRSGHVTLVRN